MRKFRLHYIVIPLLVFIVAALGSLVTSDGMLWYATLTLPVWTPPGQLIGSIWTILYILIAGSAVLVWRRFPRDRSLALVCGVFAINGLLNVLWSVLFFGQHQLARAVDASMLLAISGAVLIALIWSKSRLAAVLLVPYVLWAGVASYLSYEVWRLNGGG